MGKGDNHWMNIAYVFYIYMFGFVIPLAIISTSYLKIIKTIRLKVSHHLPTITYNVLSRAG